MPRYDTQKLTTLKKNIESYLEKNDPAFALQKEMEDSMIKQSMQVEKNVRDMKSEFERNVRLLQSSLENYIGKFSSSIDNLSRIESSSAVLSSAQKEHTQKLFEELGSSAADKIKGIVGELQNIQKTFAAINIPKFPEFPKAVSLVEAKDLKAQLIAIENSIKSIPHPDKIVIPSQVSMKEAEVLFTAIKGVEKAVVLLATNMPKEHKMEKMDMNPLIDAISRLEEKMGDMKMPAMEFPSAIEVSNFPAQLVPNPVTHISINSLRGFVKTTAATVTSTLTTLPSYGVLANRRSIQIYNNSSNTIFIGGSDVTATNGMPVPASSYSQALDLGVDTILYGIASSGSNNVRCIEVSDEASGR